MRKILPLLISIFTVFGSYAYEWNGSIKCLPEDDEILYYTTQNPWDVDNEITVVCFHGETEIEGIRYRVLLESNSIFPLADGVGKTRAYMREDAGRVYCRFQVNTYGESETGKEFLLYDFNLKPGDSYRYELPFNDPSADIEQMPEFYENEYTIRILSVEEKEIYGKKRIVQTIGYPDGYKFAREENRIISGIGYERDGTIDNPFLDRGHQLASSWYTHPRFRGIYDFAGRCLGGTDLWIERTESEREFLPMLKSGRVWEYEWIVSKGDSYQEPVRAYYRLSDAENIHGVEYYPVFRSGDESFASESLVGYIRENCGQVFVRLTGSSRIPASEKTFENIGEETILYDLNLKENEKVCFSKYTRFQSLIFYDYQVGLSEDIIYNSEPFARRYVETTACDFLEGVGPVVNATLTYPMIDATYYELPKKKRLYLKRMWDDGELVFEGSRFSGVEAIDTDTDSEAEYFTLQGIRTDAKAPGIYLRRQGSKTEKIVVR